MRGKLTRRGGISGALLAVALLATAMAVSSAAPASAAAVGPWWHLNTMAHPSYLPPGGEGVVVAIASDVGDGDVQGGSEPVTFTDTLPTGVTATSVQGQAGLFGIYGSLSCSGTTTIVCAYEGNMPPYEQLEVLMHVAVAGGAASGSNSSSISGGGAPSATASRRLTVSSATVPFGVEAYELAPEEVGGGPATQAGSHPFQLTTSLFLNGGYEKVIDGSQTAVEQPAMPKDLKFALPPGLVGNPTPFPRCSDSAFTSGEAGANNCPANTQVGVAKVSVYIPTLGFLTIASPVFNLVPSVGEPARFGFLAFVVPVILDTSLRTGGDYGVTVSVNNITQLSRLYESQVTFWGVPGDPRHDLSRGNYCVGIGLLVGGGCSSPEDTVDAPLLSLPTSCQAPGEALTSSMTADSWTEPSVLQRAEYRWQDGAGAPLGLDGCNRLGFEPSIDVAPDGQSASTPTGLTVGIHVPQESILNPAGLAQANVKDTTVALPEGMQISPAAADGLQACSLEQISLESASAPACPEASKLATVELTTPLLANKLEGAVYLAAQDANPFGSLLAMYIVVEDPKDGILIKIPGEVKLSSATGQPVAVFENTPELPFEDLKIHFFGSARAPLSTPALCGSYTTSASIAPWSGNGPAEPSSTFDVTSGPNGSPCANPLAFAPSLTAGSTNIQAGAYSPFTMTMSREDGQQNLDAIQLRMPPGLLGTLSSVKLCGEPQADAGTCGPESLIGETIVSVGLGGDPYTVTGGKVYITGPYEGAPYGLSIVNPAKAGPFDLGQVVVRAKVEVNPHTAALTITTDSSGPYAIPQIIDGIPLQIKHVNVQIDRAGFTFNPTNCDPQQITGSLTSGQGASSALAVPFQVTNCASLAFKPSFSASTSGKTSRRNGASLSVKLAFPDAPQGSEANVHEVKVELPKQLPSQLKTLQKACTAAQFAANPAGCPASSIVGHARAVTPILPVPLEGPAYFVSHGGEAFPSLEIVLQGYGVTVDLTGTTFIGEKTGITSSTFKTVPDVPVSTFELTLPEGSHPALNAIGDLCKSKLTMPTEFVAQNGMVLHQSTKVAVTGCAKAKAKKKHHRARTKHKASKHRKAKGRHHKDAKRGKAKGRLGAKGARHNAGGARHEARGARHNAKGSHGGARG